MWLECAQKLTAVIQQIIEFAKMVPGFMKLSQDDQIVLLKAGECRIHLRLKICSVIGRVRKRKNERDTYCYTIVLIAGSW